MILVLQEKQQAHTSRDARGFSKGTQHVSTIGAESFCICRRWPFKERFGELSGCWKRDRERELLLRGSPLSDLRKRVGAACGIDSLHFSGRAREQTTQRSDTPRDGRKAKGPVLHNDAHLHPSSVAFLARGVRAAVHCVAYAVSFVDRDPVVVGHCALLAVCPSNFLGRMAMARTSNTS